jgi:hypothetical protein
VSFYTEHCDPKKSVDAQPEEEEEEPYGFEEEEEAGRSSICIWVR